MRPYGFPVAVTLAATVSFLPFASAASIYMPVQLQAPEIQVVDHLIQIDMQQEVQFIEDSDAADRIELADRLRTLSQTVPSAACHLQNGVDVEANRDILTHGLSDFARYVDALLNGSDDLHILTPEDRRRTIVGLTDLQAEWSIVQTAGAQVLADTSDAAATAEIYARALPLLDMTRDILVAIEADYSNPTELLQSDALLLEVSGRQSMIAQRLSYVACQVWSDGTNAAYTDELNTLTQQFEFAVTALANGMPDLGIAAPPSDEIAAKLNDVVSNWGEITGKLTTLAANGSIDMDQATYLCRVLFAKSANMEEITHLYAEYSRRAYN